MYRRITATVVSLAVATTTGVLFCVGIAAAQSSSESTSQQERGQPAANKDQTSVPLRVSVHLPGGQHFEEAAKLQLVQDNESFPLRRARGSQLFEASVPAGTYRISLDAGEWTAPARSVEVGLPATTVSIHLGKRAWPFYRLGRNIVPFEPHDDLIAVVFPHAQPDARRAVSLVRKLQEELPIEPYPHDRESNAPFTAAEGSIWLLRITQDGELIDREQIAASIRQAVDRDVRIGLPVDLIRGQVKVIDNRFVIRFRDNLKAAEIDALVKEAEATILRGFIQAGNARLIRFNRGSYRDHLATVERWIERGLLVYGEPDIMAELTDDDFPCDDPPDDPTFATQANLTLQDVDDAWCYLNGVSAALTLGDPNVYVATLDRGVDTDHTDIGGTLTDGTNQLAQCYDFSGLRACTAAGYAPDTSHGMGVYGIIAALTDNATMMSGIAPNTHQLGLERPSLSDSNYPDVLLWAAGFNTGNPSSGWPAEPISPAADIISCSHGSDGLALSGLMDDTYQYLATYGRDGKGTLVIYSAGNGNTLITGFRTWAAHPRTMAIANSNQPDAGGVERKNGSSNFGPEIDICAQGNNAPSLNDTGGEQTFGGTSAAAPTVAAAAALMLSMEPYLTWIDLRDLLRGSAVVIDGANTDPVGQWIAGFSQWYGFGRLDVDDAVMDSHAFDTGAVNLVVRDNLADTGLYVPTSSPFWASPDLWVRNADPATDPAGDPAYGVAPPNQNAIFGTDNWVRVRVRNVGSSASSNFWVRVYLTHFAGSEFQYPTDYIPSVNTGDPLPSPLVQATYLIGEQFVSSLAATDDDIYDFLWPAALVPPETVAGADWHPCLLVEVSPHTGPVPTGVYVADNTNLAQRNLTISFPDDDDDAEMIGVIGHQNDAAMVKRIVVHRQNLPKHADVWVRFLDPRVEAAVLDRLKRPDPDRPKPCCITRCACPPAGSNAFPASSVSVVNRDGQTRFMLASGSRLVIEVPMVGGRLTPIALGASLPDGAPANSYEVPLVVHDDRGDAIGAFALELRRR